MVISGVKPEEGKMGIGDTLGAAKLIQETFPEINYSVLRAILEYLERCLNLSKSELEGICFWWRMITDPYKEDTEERRLFYKRILEGYLTMEESKALQKALGEIKEKFFAGSAPKEETPFEERIRREIERGRGLRI